MLGPVAFFPPQHVAHAYGWHTVVPCLVGGGMAFPGVSFLVAVIHAMEPEGAWELGFSRLPLWQSLLNRSMLSMLTQCMKIDLLASH